MPQQQPQQFNPQFIIGIILNRRWFIIVPFCLAVIIGSYLAITLPKRYEASTMIIVQAQKVPDSYVQSVVSTDITSRLNTITQQVLSRTNIERIIETYNLFDGPEYENMYLEDQVSAVRERINVSVEKSSRNTELSTFSISYKGQEPKTVQQIANALATYIIDENLKVREAQATGTSDFLDDELEMMRQRLEKSEQQYTEYRQKYMGELPEQLDANLSILSRLSEELMEKQKTLRETNADISELESQATEAGRNRASLSADGSEDDLDSGDLWQLQAQLESLQARYTENHPSVVRLKNMIRKLEETAAAPDENTSETAEEDLATLSPLEKQLRGLKLQAENMETEIADLKSKIEGYQARVENTPKREEELLSIQRDYNNLQEMYNSLLNRQLEAEISVNMEKKQKGEQFQIIDAARLPEKPISPDMDRLFLMVIVGGLGVGGALVFLLEFMKSSFRSVDDVESTLGLPILATIPPVQHPGDMLRERLNNVFSIAATAVSILLLAGFACLTLKGVDTTMELVRRFM